MTPFHDDKALQNMVVVSHGKGEEGTSVQRVCVQLEPGQYRGNLLKQFVLILVDGQAEQLQYVALVLT